jgi:general secretion pathway protein G
MPSFADAKIQAQRRRLCGRRAKRGMTLLEASLVVALVALMACAAVSFMRSKPYCPPHFRTEADIEHLRMQLLLYRTKTGALPNTDQGLKALVSRPSGDPQPAHWKQYLSELPVDPWGSEYQYRCPGTRSKDSFEIFSCGKDKIPDTGDDVGNW